MSVSRPAVGPWQDEFKNTLGLEGSAYRAEKENFPKLWITNIVEERVSIEANDDGRFMIFFSPRAGKVYTNTKKPTLMNIPSESDPMGPRGERLQSQNLVKPGASNMLSPRRLLQTIWVHWKESVEPEVTSQSSCLLYFSDNRAGNNDGNITSYNFLDFDDMEEIKSPKMRIFSVGSPLKDAKLTTARYGAYTSIDWGDTGAPTFGFSFPSLVTGLFETFFGDGVPAYGSAGRHSRIAEEIEPEEIERPSVTTTRIKSLPVSLQGRGQLFPMLERIKLRNAKNYLIAPQGEVYQFRTSRNNVMFFSVSETRLEQRALLEDKPRTWYLMENPQIDTVESSYVLGIGQNYARVHMYSNEDSDTALAFEILKESDLFDTETLRKPLKERTARVIDDVNSGSTNMTAGKLRRVTEEIAAHVSYKTICTILQPASPQGKDLTMNFYLEQYGEIQELRLVLYAVRKKYVKYLGTIGDSNITYLVGVWNNSELVDAYWGCAEDTLDDTLNLVHDVKKVMQKGEVIPSDSLIRANLDVQPPNLYFSNIPGEYGAAFREAALQDFERQKGKSNSDPIFGFKLTDIAKTLADTAQSVAQSGLLGETAKTIGDTGLISTAVAGLFGLSETEPIGDEVHFNFEGPFDREQPYLNIKGVFDQKQNDTCVLCSICHAISVIKPKPEGDTAEDFLESIYRSVTNVIPVSTVPKGIGLNITDTLGKLNEVLISPYDLTWKRITPNVTSIKNVLDSGLPVIAGTIFDRQLFDYRNNLDEPIDGPIIVPGTTRFMHCVTIVAYDDSDSTFTVLNSYGSTWGRNGAMIIEQDYGGFNRAFVLEPNPALFGIVDIQEGLPTIPFE